MEASLIFPHQLYSDHPLLKRDRLIAFIEDDLFFKQYPFHKHKLILHRASMKAFENTLKEKGYSTLYIQSTENISLKDVFVLLTKKEISLIHFIDPTDYLLSRRIKRFASACQLKLMEHESPNFICDTGYLNEYFNSKKKYFLTEFYIEQRKRLNLLIDNGKPIGGQWTFDQENRKRLPRETKIPESVVFESNSFVIEAKAYISKNFARNPGNVKNFNYPITAEEAQKNLHHFIQTRLTQYGIYQDAIDIDQTFLFHSILTPALNIGLLSPMQIVDEVMEVEKLIPINSLEGFIRQIIGWREFIRAVYLRKGIYQRTNNHFHFHRKIPSSFWNGTTAIKPVDNVISKVLTHAYSNHIERLMVMGNFMLLCGFHPDEVYTWFMSLYIDAYDWVMVPNVYGMSQYADGRLMSTKPYISGSNYLLKMSHFKKEEWCTVWDSLYWVFIKDHESEFVKNPRMSMMVRQLNKMDNSKFENLRKIRTNFLSQLDIEMDTITISDTV